MRFRLRSRVVALGWLAAAGVALAQTDISWTGLGADANWTTPGNWQDNTAPASDGTAQILFSASAARRSVAVDVSQNVAALKFDFTTGDISSFLLSGSATTLTLGSGGMAVYSGTPSSEVVALSSHPGVVVFDSSLGLVLGANQTWHSGTGGVVFVNGTVSGAGQLTIAGEGYVRLSGNNTYTGGTVLQGGALVVESDSALGTGTLKVTGNTELISLSGARTFGNALELNTPLLELLPYGGDFTFTGDVTLTGSSTIANEGQPVYFTGPIGESGGTRALSFSGSGKVYLSGANTYSGGTAVYDGALLFRNAGSIPAGGTLSSGSDGYIGTTFNTGVQSGFIARFSTANTFGTIGFDTDPAATSTTTFTEAVDLSAFNTFARLGTTNRAVLSADATITPSTTGGYRFGGGGGTLTVQSPLTGSRAVTAEGSSGGAPLTVYLTSTANNYTGATSATHTALVFATGAAPIGSSLILGAGGYIGTEDLSLLPSLWIGRFSTSSLSGVIGFDTNDLDNPIVVGSALTPINLSRFTGTGTSLALGTTSAARLDGTITLPTNQTDYYFTGYKGGWLTVNSLLSGARAMRIGDAFGYYPEHDPNDLTRISTVFVNAANTHTGGTFLHSGRLVLGNAGALGTGALTVTGAGSGILPRLETSMTSNPTFSNALVVQDDFQIGGVNALTWSGNISSGTATTGTITKNGTFTLSLTGDNAAFSGGFYINAGTIAFGSNTAAGTGQLELGYDSAVASFTSAAPSIGGLESDATTAQVQLASGTTLTINQASDDTYRGQIQGAGGIVKSGSGSLRLTSANTYAGGTTIDAGTLRAATSDALGTGAVTLNGATATLGLEAGVTLSNTLIFGANGGTIAGHGTLSSAVALGGNSGIAPGSSVGLLSFASGLTWGPGGFYQLEIQDATGGAGTGWDSIDVTGTLTFNATVSSPFTIYLGSLTSGGASGMPANFLSSNAYSWAIASATSLVGFDASAIALNTSAFAASLDGGSFNLSTAGNTLYLNFTPVPEPSTWALLLAGLGGLAFTQLRRRRR